MARAKTFDPDTILDKAIDLLWHQGYEKTSVQELVTHLGIGRGSLYDTFGDKHQLYLAALDRYQQQSAARFLHTLTSNPSAKAAIHQLFANVVDSSLTDPHHKGCFITNATAELAPHDTAVSQRIIHNRNFITQALQHTIERGQADGDIAAHHNAPALAHYLFNTLQGIRIVAKTAPSRQVLDDTVTITLASL